MTWIAGGRLQKGSTMIDMSTTMNVIGRSGTSGTLRTVTILQIIGLRGIAIPGTGRRCPDMTPTGLSIPGPVRNGRPTLLAWFMLPSLWIPVRLDGQGMPERIPRMFQKESPFIPATLRRWPSSVIWPPWVNGTGPIFIKMVVRQMLGSTL